MDDKTKILLIDDDPSISILIKAILEQEKYDIFEAADGDSGIKLALKEIPHLVIVDIMLPNVSGYEVLETLRKDPKIKHIPILVCSVKNRSVDIHKFFDLGANDYISKPFDAKQLKYKIKKLLGHPVPLI